MATRGTVIGAFCCANGECMLVFHERFQKSWDVMDFIGSVANATPARKVAIFLDGATIHRAKRVRERAE